MSSVHSTVTLGRPTRARSVLGVLPIVRVVSAVAVTAADVAVGMAAQAIVRRRADGPDNRVIETCSAPNKSLS